MTTEREAEYIFYMACAVVGKVNVPFPNVRPDWQKIYEISAYHRIENIVAYAVEQLCLNKEYCEQIPDEVKKQFQKARLSGIMRETIQYHEYEKLTKLFEEEGIERMLLKGGLLKYEYPSQDMRFLTDLDILVKTKDLERVSVLMEKLGYRVLHKGGHHDVYQKEPCMTVEIHKRLWDRAMRLWIIIWKESGNEAQKKKDVRQSIRCPGKIFICTRQDIWRSTSSMEEQGYGCC